jgi:hypothetical protein
MLKIVSQSEDFKDLLFLVSEVSNAQSMSEIIEATGLIVELYNRLKKKCNVFGYPSSEWHTRFKETHPKEYRERQRTAGKGRQAQLKRSLGEDGYKQYQGELHKNEKQVVVGNVANNSKRRKKGSS